MDTEVGEYLVGAYLKMVVGCQFVDYNVRSPGGGQNGLRELDVVGFDFTNNTVYLCEVTTHIRGLLYGNGTQDTLNKIIEKHEWQKTYAEQYLRGFPHRRYQLWSPYVPEGKITTGLAAVTSLELVINEAYTVKVNELRDIARETSYDTGNPVFRLLQILEHLRPVTTDTDL